MEYRSRRSLIPSTTEEQEQIYLINWCETVKKAYPDIEMIFHIPNGGLRSKTEAARMKAGGVRRGVPDLFLPVAKGKYHGLFIEMKTGENKPSEDQWRWIRRLRRNGYAAEVCYGWREAWDALQAYYKLGEMKGDNQKDR